MPALSLMPWSRRCTSGALLTRRAWCDHSDRGAQYVSIRYTKRLAEAGIEPSVGSVGDSYDNALAETINGLYKAEVIHRRGSWRSFEGVEFATLTWVDWFNHRRLLQPIANILPAEAEDQYYAMLDKQKLAAWLKPNSLRQTRGGSVGRLSSHCRGYFRRSWLGDGGAGRIRPRQIRLRRHDFGSRQVRWNNLGGWLHGGRWIARPPRHLQVNLRNIEILVPLRHGRLPYWLGRRPSSRFAPRLGQFRRLIGRRDMHRITWSHSTCANPQRRGSCKRGMHPRFIANIDTRRGGVEASFIEKIRGKP